MAANDESPNTSVFIKQIGGDFYFQTGFVSRVCPVIKDVYGKSVASIANNIPGSKDVFVFAYGFISGPLDGYKLLIGENYVAIH